MERATFFIMLMHLTVHMRFNKWFYWKQLSAAPDMQSHGLLLRYAMHLCRCE